MSGITPEEFLMPPESLLIMENEKLRRQVNSLTAEVEVLLSFVLEVQQWGSTVCRCSFNAGSLLEKLRRGVDTKKEW